MGVRERSRKQERGVYSRKGREQGTCTEVALGGGPGVHKRRELLLSIVMHKVGNRKTERLGRETRTDPKNYKRRGSAPFGSPGRLEMKTSRNRKKK